jgi:hypothetical protein
MSSRTTYNEFWSIPYEAMVGERERERVTSIPAWRDTLRNGTLSILPIIIKSTKSKKLR